MSAGSAAGGLLRIAGQVVAPRAWPKRNIPHSISLELRLTDPEVGRPTVETLSKFTHRRELYRYAF